MPMKLLPEQIAELNPNFLWVFGMRLRLIRAIVLGHQISEADAPTMEESTKRIHWALERRDMKAEEQAIVDYMWAELTKWWHGFPQAAWLADLFRRDERRRTGCSDCDKCRRPTHSEGLRVAEGLLAGIPAYPEPFDPEGESTALAEVLAALLSPPFGASSPEALRAYIEHSEFNRVYFDALQNRWEQLRRQGKVNDRPLFKWQREVAGGIRRRPAKRRIPRYRPIHLGRLLRDLNLQFTLAVLEEVGIEPRGTFVSGCRIVSEATGLPEDSVIRVWKERVWSKSFAFLLRKYSKPIAERNGPFHTTPKDHAA